MSSPSRPGAALLLATLAVVYGDIGTSPLYAMKECFSPASPHHVEPTPANVLGILSLIFWSLTVVVTVKYVSFVLRADNDGKGGILALVALVHRGGPPTMLVLMALFGFSLICGEGVITPAISVLSAMEGLEVATTSLKPAIVPLTCVILIGLFAIQKRGTGKVGTFFGPITFIWFATLAVLGLREIVDHPEIFVALDPRHAVRFFLANGWHGFLMLGGIVLVITGVEALYADLGHFGRGPIKMTWLYFVFPALLLNYFGQGALLLRDPSRVTNPFYALVPEWALYPVVVIATTAAVVASQALISGVFSLTQQATQLGFLPRVTIEHTSKDAEAQIYVPEVNRLLLVVCIALVLAFRTSTNLAGAYGIAVTGTMAITSIAFYVVVTRVWGWSKSKAIPLVGVFLVFDIAFFVANAAKFFDGGWFPLVMAGMLFAVMTTWVTGRLELGKWFRSGLLPLELFLDDVSRVKPHRVNGTAVFMAQDPHGTPTVLLHHFKHNQVLHNQVVLLSVLGADVPEVAEKNRITVDDKGQGFYRVQVRYGFMERPRVPASLAACEAHGLKIVPGNTSYYLGRETLLATGPSKMARWRKTLFAFISRNARPATAYFGLPPNRVVEMGIQVEL